MLTPREKSPLPKMSPEEDRTRDAVDSEPKHYQLSYSGPIKAQFEIFYNLLTAPTTVSNTYAQVARAHSSANPSSGQGTFQCKSLK